MKYNEERRSENLIYTRHFERKKNTRQERITYKVCRNRWQRKVALVNEEVLLKATRCRKLWRAIIPHVLKCNLGSKGDWFILIYSRSSNKKSNQNTNKLSVGSRTGGNINRELRQSCLEIKPWLYFARPGTEQRK